jgi:hypothetical protein
MNFGYLENQDELSMLFTYCHECEAFVHTQADISLTAARKAMEYITKLLYGTKISPDMQRMSLFEILSDYDFVDYLGDRTLVDAIHEVRRKGNQAVHEGNMTSADAMCILEKLHYIIGEMCIKLGVITEYSPFDPNSVQSHEAHTAEGISPDVSDNLIQRISQIMRSRMKVAGDSSVKAKIIDVHIDPAKDTEAIQLGKATKGTDSGANGKTAYQYIASFISNALPDVQVLMETVKSELILIKDNKETVITVKTGCAGLGTKNHNGQWQLLPGVDYVLYAPDVVAEFPIEDQFQLFTEDAFITFWEDLGLLRYKVSTAMRKRVIAELGTDAKISTEEYADVISIQSFMNSGKKYPMVKQRLASLPILSKDSLQDIL